MWIHIHCAYWSAEVYELSHLAFKGVLFDVHAAISRGRSVVGCVCVRARAQYVCTYGCVSLCDVGEAVTGSVQHWSHAAL